MGSVLEASAECRGRVVYGRILAGAMALVGITVLAHVGVALWAGHEFTQPESIVAGQSRLFAEQGTLYYGLKQYPYTVCAYMPLFYTAVAGMSRTGFPVQKAGRMLSVIAIAAILWLIWKIVLLYTQDRYCAGTALALGAGIHLLCWWGTVGQTDVPAIALSLGAFYQYSRYRICGEDRCIAAGLLAMAGLLTKQTVIAAPAAVFVLLALQRPRKAAAFAAIAGGAGGAIVLSLDAALDGRFLANTVFANINPFAWHKVAQHFDYARAAFPLSGFCFGSIGSHVRQGGVRYELSD
jgi:hypothetical protein